MFELCEVLRSLGVRVVVLALVLSSLVDMVSDAIQPIRVYILLGLLLMGVALESSQASVGVFV